MMGVVPERQRGRPRSLEGWISVGRGGRLVEANEIALVVLGCDLASLDRLTVADLSCESSRDGAVEAWREIVSGRLAMPSGVVEIRAKDGWPTRVRGLALDRREDGATVVSFEVVPDAATTGLPRPRQALVAWMAAELRLRSMTPGDPAREALACAVEELKASYRREEARGGS